MKKVLISLCIAACFFGSNVNAQEFLAPHNLSLGVTGGYYEKLKYVFREAYARDSIIQVLIRGGSPERVIFIRQGSGGPQLMLATAAVRVYDFEVKDSWREMEKDRGGKLNGIDGLKSLGDFKDIKVSLIGLPISEKLYAKVKETWAQELMSVRRDVSGSKNLTLDGAGYDYSMRMSSMSFISGTARDGDSARLDKLASIARALASLAEGEASEEEVLKKF